MDYKEKYEQALEVAKETYNKQPIYREWLEKMFPELKESEDEIIRKVLVGFFKSYKEQGTCGSETFNGIPTNNIIAWLEKQGEQKPISNVPSREVILAIWDLGNEWKELTNGSISTEYGTQLDYIQKHWQESKYYLRAMQDEQKFVDKVEPKFKHGDRVRNKKSGLEQTLGNCIEDVYEGAFPFRIKDQDDWELVEQKPIDNAEPKFNVGEWIVENGVK